jgi:predicted AAA+ superfamily ATPase
MGSVAHQITLGRHRIGILMPRVKRAGFVLERTYTCDSWIMQHINVQKEIEQKHIDIIHDRQLLCVMGWGVENRTQ